MGCVVRPLSNAADGRLTSSRDGQQGTELDLIPGGPRMRCSQMPTEADDWSIEARERGNLG